MTEVITGLHAVTLHIRDIRRARTFYRDVLGLQELSFNERASRGGLRAAGLLDHFIDAHPGPGRRGEEIRAPSRA